MSERLIRAYLLIAAFAATVGEGFAAPVTISNITTLQYPSPGDPNTHAMGISGNNIVGWYDDLSFSRRAFLYDGSSYTTLLGIYAHGIDGSNVVGTTTDANGSHGFLYNITTSTYTNLDDPLSANGLDLGTHAEGISGNNVVGYYFDAAKVAHGFVYNIATNSYTTLDDPKAGTDSGDGTFAEGISGNNIVGYYVDPFGRSHGFLYNGTSFITLSGMTYAYGISGNYIVGDQPGGSFGSLSGVIYDGTNYASGFIYQFYGISGSKIVGSYVSSVGVAPSYSGFVATIPEPSSLLLAAVGGIALASLAYRNRRQRRKPRSSSAPPARERGGQPSYDKFR